MSDTNININVKTNYDGNGQKAIADFDRMAKAVEEATAALNSMKGSVQSATSEGAKGAKEMSEEEDKASSSTRSLSETLRSLRSAASGIDYPFKNLVKSLTRIAKLRVLRGIIRSITGAFKEGLGNIYQYSVALNNTDASHMQSSLNSAATSLLYMKNAVGAAVAPLIASLIPTLQQVVGWFVNAASAVAQFFAVLNGQTTYTKAKETATQWGTVASGASDAAAAAKEYKNTILGFDEINALDAPTGGGGGGGGGGADVPNYADMFEEAPIKKSWVTDLAKWLKDNWQSVLEIVEAIGVALLAWKIADSVMDFFNKLGLDGAGKVAAGVIISITGFTLAYTGAKDIGYNGPDLGNIVKTAIGNALGVAGTALVFSGLGLGAGAGALVGLTLGIAITLAGIKVGMMQKAFDDTIASTEWFKELGEMIEFADEKSGTYASTAKTLRGRLEKLGTATSDYKEVADAAFAESLIGRIKDLASKTSLTKTETDELRAKCKILNDMGLEGIRVEFDETTKSVTANWQEIDKCIAKIKEEAMTRAQVDLLTEAYKDLYSAQVDHKKIAQDAQVALERVKKTQIEYTAALAANAGEIDHTDQNMLNLFKANQKAEEAYTKLRDLYKENTDAIVDMEDVISILEGTLGVESTSLDEVKESAKNAKGQIDNVTESTKTKNKTKVDTRSDTQQLNNMSGAAKTANGNLDGTKGAVDGVNKKHMDTSQQQGQLHNLGSKGIGARDALYDAKDSLDGVNSYKMNTAKNCGQIDNIKNSSQNASTAITGTGGLDDSLNSLNNVKIEAKGIEQFFTNIGTWIDNVGRDIGSFIANLIGIDDNFKTTKENIETTKNRRSRGNSEYAEGGFVTRYANGGFIPRFDGGGINSADVFLANENGMPPELIGRIGNRTAVANQGQMVDAMAAGVYRAMSELMAQNNGSTEVNIYMDSRKVANAVDKANRERNRRFNVRMA